MIVTAFVSLNGSISVEARNSKHIAQIDLIFSYTRSIKHVDLSSSRMIQNGDPDLDSRIY